MTMVGAAAPAGTETPAEGTATPRTHTGAGEAGDVSVPPPGKTVSSATHREAPSAPPPVQAAKVSAKSEAGDASTRLLGGPTFSTRLPGGRR